ncbi:MAG: mitochondrial fission ELM1 family protein [Alphaproteobacteria bacterium]|nr:mitochondrial fission ELM1 family protein [Alphaproteobacteria bacterium]
MRIPNPDFKTSTLISSQKTACWVVTDGKAGMENQCIGLAEALGFLPIVKRVKLKSPWKQLVPFLRCGLSHAFSDTGDSLSPPWPDVLISCGRAGIGGSLYVRRASRKNGARGVFTVHIQNPVIAPSLFDLVIVPRHDRLMGPNIIATRGSLHRITPEILSREAEKFLPRVANLPSPRIAVLIGGTSAVYSLTPHEMKGIAAQLADVAKQYGLMITTSRRTGEENLAVLQQALEGTKCFIWDGKGDNPYFGMLGLAEAVLVTCDSVNMVCEACVTGKPVMVISLPGGSEKFRRFHQAMRDDGFTRPFNGCIETWSYPPLDEMSLVAARIKAAMEAREQ